MSVTLQMYICRQCLLVLCATNTAKHPFHTCMHIYTHHLSSIHFMDCYANYYLIIMCQPSNSIHTVVIIALQKILHVTDAMCVYAIHMLPSLIMATQLNFGIFCLHGINQNPIPPCLFFGSPLYFQCVVLIHSI